MCCNAWAKSRGSPDRYDRPMAACCYACARLVLNSSSEFAVLATFKKAKAKLGSAATASLKCAFASMKRARSSSRWPLRKWSRATAEDVVMGCCITALVMGSSVDRGSCATAPAYQPTDANSTVRTDRMVASFVAAEHAGRSGGSQEEFPSFDSFWT